ncbi:hypothetical protein K491DRAFT_688956 [Lophiostoma macrostomum CBS 122681]|uniref:Uncharacterized protein n=1 Tax=Lophiostoma macrostomum CBS 122681 TaxID=1314788 RepID=A0A6A6TJK3_9PLEO|nr:hypothetical protein K491DRAFT_688956 [Lophiostoma macrostomum CBS 122681]
MAARPRPDGAGRHALLGHATLAETESATPFAHSDIITPRTDRPEVRRSQPKGHRVIMRRLWS